MTKEISGFKEIIDELFERDPLWLYESVKMAKIAVKLSKSMVLDAKEEALLKSSFPEEFDNNKNAFEKKALLGLSTKALIGTLLGLGALALFAFPLLTIGGAGFLSGLTFGGGSKMRLDDKLSDYIESEAAKIQIEKMKDLIGQTKNLRKKKKLLKDYFDVDIQ
jgi:hypothetical protein